MPFPKSINESSKNGFIGRNLPTTAVKSFLNKALCVGLSWW